ncbi:hypothetical protein OAU67_02475, partial [Candidatus Thioglobus sp.]|nr:hypothetical protein [Candidatus Thioglobus sp.]
MPWFGKNKKQELDQKLDDKQGWNKDLKLNNSISNSAKQQGFIFEENIDATVVIDTSSTKKGLSCNIEEISSEQVQVLRNCQLESSAEELMKILKRTHKHRFKNDILNPLLDCHFFERTIPEKPKSPKQKYRLTSKFSRS